MYLSDDGDVLGMRYDNWKVVFMEQRRQGTLRIWAEPFIRLRRPKFFNLRTDPYERADRRPTPTGEWFMDHVPISYGAQALAATVGGDVQGLPAHSEAQHLHARRRAEDDARNRGRNALIDCRRPVRWPPAAPHRPKNSDRFRMLFAAEAGQPAGHSSDMVAIPGGTFLMGSDHHYPEEAPAHRVTVAPFWIDRTPVTNRQFKQFVAATGYLTVAEIAPEPKDYPDALPHMLNPGSLVFTAPKHPVDLRDWSQWWRFAFGANWRHPFGRGKQRALPDHPVVHIAYKDAQAFCGVGGKETADGSRMGVRRASRTEWSRVCLGRRAGTWRTSHGEYVARNVPAGELGDRRISAHFAGQGVSAQCVWRCTT